MALPRRHAGDVLAVQRQRRPRRRPARCEIEFRGTKGTLYLSTNGYEVVPEIVTPNEFPARDADRPRRSRSGWRDRARRRRSRRRR